MKKTLLTLIAAAALSTGASAFEFSNGPVYTVNGVFDDYRQVFQGATAIGPEGHLYGAGAYVKDFTFGSTQSTAVGQSAFLTDGKWLVSLEGSATITAVTANADGVYIAGTFADEVIVGSTDGDTQTITGASEDGQYYTDQLASFVAAYTLEGKLKAVKTFITTPITFSFDPTVFTITDLKASADKLYATAVYTGETEAGNFHAAYNDPWGGVYFIDLRAAAVFELSTDLLAVEKIVNCTPANQETEDGQYQALGAALGIDAQGNAYAVFSANGPVTVGGETITANPTDYNYIIYSKTDKTTTLVSAGDPGAAAQVQPKAVFVEDGAVKVVGYQSLQVEGSEDSQFVISYIADGKLTTATTAAGNISYYKVQGAVDLGKDGILIAANGYYNTTDKDAGISLNDFAGNSSLVLIDNDTFSTSDFCDYPVAIASYNEKVAIACLNAYAYDFTSYNNENYTGIENIAIDNADAPVEYFNLQGARIANPTAGFVIRRAGNVVEKIFVK